MQPNGAMTLPRNGQWSPTETCREIFWMKTHWSEAHSSVAFLPSMSCFFLSSLSFYRWGWIQTLNIHHLTITFFFFFNFENHLLFKSSKSFAFCSNYACCMYACWKLTISSESHKILKEVIKVSQCKAMMRSQKVNAVLGDHRHILKSQGNGKKCGSNLSFLLPLLSVIDQKSQAVFKSFLFLFFLICA